MTPLERAARALAEADAKGRANLYDANPELYTRLARAVLMSVREPNDRMMRAFTHSNIGGFNVANGTIPATSENAAIAWRKMIDAILADGDE